MLWWQGLELHSFIVISQFRPVKPAGHLHSYLDPWGIQVPKFKQGMITQPSSAACERATILPCSQKAPVKIVNNYTHAILCNN
jgi:hypothetical protein